MMMNDPKKIWRDQPAEGNHRSMTLEELREKGSRFRRQSQRELLAGAGAAVIVALLPWRFQFQMGLWYDLALAVTIGWALAAAIWFRRRIWPGVPDAGGMAANGLEFYRAGLADRRDHLRTAWIWRGPAFAALGLLAVPLVARSVSWRSAAPFLVLAAVWTVAALIQARQQWRAIDEELRSLDSMR